MGIATRESTIAIGFAFPIITSVLIALRFYTRHHQKAERQIDDWLCLPAWVCLAGCCACLLTGIFKDAFVDQPITTPEAVTPGQRLLAQVVFALVKLYIVSNLFIKLTILFLYRRIFLGRWFNVVTLGLIVFSIIWGIYAFIASVLYCGTTVRINAEGGWVLCPQYGFGLQMGTFVVDTIIDFCLIVLPIPFVWKLQLAPVKKVLIVVVFMLGGFAFVASLSNTIIQMTNLLEPAVAATGGKFFQGSWLLFYNWPVIEIGVGLIACNLPVISFRAFRALFRHMKRGWTLSWASIRRGSAQYNQADQPRRKRDSNIRWPGNKGVAPTWYRTFTGKNNVDYRSVTTPEDDQSLKSRVAMQLSGARKEDGEVEMWDFAGAAVKTPEKAQTLPTTRHDLEQTDSRTGLTDSNNGKVIGNFESV